jgi:hypothetical protein
VVDLNLLRLVPILAKEKNVTRAAQKPIFHNLRLAMR